ncbi:MAG: hypothetical protein H6Q67_493 [Firmicutes bacterium]|nr:hypothetical protein [Bacillota bacterium]
MIIVSACLAGIECRYNGQSFPIPEVIDLAKKGQAIPLCPEILGKLPTPRPCVEICGERFLTADGTDKTEAFILGAKIAVGIANLVGCEKAILKAKSPSCGCGLIYDGTFTGNLVQGDGIFCRLLKEERIQVCTETEYC